MSHLQEPIRVRYFGPVSDPGATHNLLVKLEQAKKSPILAEAQSNQRPVTRLQIQRKFR